jgi:hypothetical protein
MLLVTGLVTGSPGAASAGGANIIPSAPKSGTALLPPPPDWPPPALASAAISVKLGWSGSVGPGLPPMHVISF